MADIVQKVHLEASNQKSLLHKPPLKLHLIYYFVVFSFDLDTFLLNKIDLLNMGRLWQPISDQSVSYTKI